VQERLSLTRRIEQPFNIFLSRLVHLDQWRPGAFEALATSSAGFAATLGRRDAEVTREEALVHLHQVVQGTNIPIAADPEDGFADEPAATAAGSAISDKQSRLPN
jgi:hypothetical protein